MGTHYPKSRYLDASAIVKVFFEEDGSDLLRDQYHSKAGYCATSLCLTEALSVLKTKYKYEHLDFQQYLSVSKRLLVDAWSGKLEIDEIALLSIKGIRDVEALVTKYDLDWSDALQLKTILFGKYSALVDENRSILITADAQLAVAARSEGIRVWNCIKEPLPEWA